MDSTLPNSFICSFPKQRIIWASSGITATCMLLLTPANVSCRKWFTGLRDRSHHRPVKGRACYPNNKMVSSDVSDAISLLIRRKFGEQVSGLLTSMEMRKTSPLPKNKAFFMHPLWWGWPFYYQLLGFCRQTGANIRQPWPLFETTSTRLFTRSLRHQRATLEILFRKRPISRRIRWVLFFCLVLCSGISER